MSPSSGDCKGVSEAVTYSSGLFSTAVIVGIRHEFERDASSWVPFSGNNDISIGDGALDTENGKIGCFLALHLKRPVNAFAKEVLGRWSWLHPRRRRRRRRRKKRQSARLSSMATMMAITISSKDRFLWEDEEVYDGANVLEDDGELDDRWFATGIE
jgi:hypothetical protein